MNTIEYSTLFNYSPRGHDAISEKSRQITGSIKAVRNQGVQILIDGLSRPESKIINPFLNDNAILVPIPGSVKYSKGKTLWPSLVLAECLAMAGYGKDVRDLLKRFETVRKSHLARNADDRESVEKHRNTISTSIQLFPPDTNFTLIDDVISLGRTSYACASLLKEQYPESNIKVFAAIRTCSFFDIKQVFEPHVSTVSFNPASGKTTRHD